MIDSVAHAEIAQLVGRFANSFDRKDWLALGLCLADEVLTDYSDLRGTPTERLSRDQFVQSRQSALATLMTHHLGGNHEIQVSGPATAVATVSMVIYRRTADNQVLNTHCIYEFGLSKSSGAWQIDAIVQRVLWSNGNPAIHRGIRVDRR